MKEARPKESGTEAGRGLVAALGLLVALLAAVAAVSAPSRTAAQEGPPVCGGAAAALSFDYRYAVGSAAYISPTGGAESGSTFRWLLDGAPTVSGTVSDSLLLHLDGSVDGANGEVPTRTAEVAYVAGRWGQALSLGEGGSLAFALHPGANFDPAEGTLEMWAALRADGDDPIYTGTWQVLFYYADPGGDYLTIAQAEDTGVLYAGGEVGGQWQSAYGDLGSMRTWHTGEWHHLAATYSAAGNFIRFYVDGVLAADTNESHYWPPGAGGTEFTIGGTPWDEAAAYDLDEVRIAGRALGGDEIAEHARRLDAPNANEVWLPVDTLAPSATLVYEYTPSDGLQYGEACSSSLLVYPGIPISETIPPSTLLPAGSTEISLTVRSTEPTTCAYAVGEPLPYVDMTPFNQGAGSTQHQAKIGGLDPDPNVVNDIYVRCAAHPDYLLPLRYRSLSDADPSFPRTGNLWGWWGVEKGLDYAARVDLWLGTDFTPGQVRELRRLNPDIRVLYDINAVENFNLPDDYYLKNVDGTKIEVWPGSFRLNLTKLYVAEYQAGYAYRRVLDTDLMIDGVFFDNVMTTQSWLHYDCWGNPVHIDADEDGVEDDPDALDAAWKAGVFHEIETFRRFMPYALASGHSLDIYEPGIGELFNGMNMGFWTADVIEGKMQFAALWNRYNLWHIIARPPYITMIESAPPDQIAYGYDYSPWEKIPTSTLEFARTYYPYVRFGLALTLMNDGYFAHEFGDTWHGNDWWYDELNLNLGRPLGPAQQVPDGPAPANLLPDGGFESSLPLTPGRDTACTASVRRDATDAAVGRASARVEGGSCPAGGVPGVESAGLSLRQGTGYDVKFWARSDRPRSIAVSIQGAAVDWGMGDGAEEQQVGIGPTWQPYVVSFDALETAPGARLRFDLGGITGTVWLDELWLGEQARQVYRREFTNGLVLLNGTRDPQVVDVGPDYRRLIGRQAPFYETISDDVAPTFGMSGTWTAVTYDSGEWQAAGPFYHDWGAGCHEHSGGQAGAWWGLTPWASSPYTITAWWPAAPQSAGWSRHVVYDVIQNGVVLTSTVLDQSTGGDEWHLVAVVPLAAWQTAYVRVRCDGDAPCIADAVHVRSQARYNNGAIAGQVLLGPWDGIVLRRAGDRAVYLPIVQARR